VIPRSAVDQNTFKLPRPFTRILACPADRSLLQIEGERAVCSNCGTQYTRTNGIWRFITREEEPNQFLDHYKTVRRFEGWGSSDPTYYRNLPLVEANDSHADIWRVRAASFRALLNYLKPGQRVLDMGAGNGWLANRLAQAGHSVAALDLSDDAFDGLRAAKHYLTTFELYQATFDALPFADSQFDVLVYNASLHYSTNLSRTLSEGLDVLVSDGTVIVMDSPMYRNPISGQAMLAEKMRGFEKRFDSIGPTDRLGFLTFYDFESLAREFSIRWRWVEPFVNLRWAVRRERARWLGRREPARFGLMIGTRAYPAKMLE
jgi:SAM-dependent methyltransferase